MLLATLCLAFVAASLAGASGIGAPDDLEPHGLLVVWPGALINLAERVAFGLPLGALFGLRATRAQRAWVWLFAAPLALALVVEAAQLFAVGRHARAGDALLACGALWAGAVAAFALAGGDKRYLIRPIGLQITALALTHLATLGVGGRLSLWECDMPILTGDEVGGGRAWSGTLHGVRLAPAAMTPEAIAAARVGSIDPEKARAFCAAARRSNAFTVIADITPALAEQTGPARIVTMSRSTGSRNFTLGQDGRAYVIRQRTLAGGANGDYPVMATGPVVEAGKLQRVAATYANGQARLYVDGALAGGPFRTSRLELPFYAYTPALALFLLCAGWAATLVSGARGRNLARGGLS